MSTHTASTLWLLASLFQLCHNSYAGSAHSFHDLSPNNRWALATLNATTAAAGGEGSNGLTRAVECFVSSMDVTVAR